MKIGTGTSTWHAQNAQNGATATSNRSASSQGKTSRWSDPDTVDISDQARDMYTSSKSGGIDTLTPGEFGLYQPSETATAVTGKNLKKYLNNASGATGLTAMNMSRKNLGARIDSVIKGAGINLRADEKLTISVDAKNNIVVGGIKDKEKAKAIQEALNEDKKLGREMRKHVASAKISDYSAKQSAYEKQMKQFGIDVGEDLGEDGDGVFKNSGVRSLVIEEYLQDNAGIGLADLSLEKGADGSVSIGGMTSELNALLSEDPDLGATIAEMLENGETGSTFKASFEFANGTLSDSSTTDAAKAKLEGVKARLMGGVDTETGEFTPGIVDQVLETLKEAGDVDEKFMAALGKGFSIRVDASGKFELIGLDGVDAKLQETLKVQVEKALRDWAGEDPQNRIASFSDVAEAYIEQHRFEHGDVDEFQHMIEINFAGSAADAKVVSPEADKAQDKANQEVAGRLGDALRVMLDENGIDIDGLDMEIDETGKITVLGDPENAEVKKAQTLIDQFVEEAKASGASAAKGDPAENNEVENERRDIRAGKKGEEETSDTPEGFGSRDVVAKGEASEAEKFKAFQSELTEKIRPFLPNPDFDDAPGGHEDPYSMRIRDTYVSWQKVMNETGEAANFIGNVASVSNIGTRKYAALAATVDGTNAFGASKGLSYGSDAKGLYYELMDDMTQFHDGRRKVNYSLSASA